MAAARYDVNPAMSKDPLSHSHIADLRRDYMLRGLDEADVDPDPFRQFARWFQEALDCPAIAEANAMVVSTISADGKPHGRIVLLKGFDAKGFIFFTNYQSEKGHDLQVHPHAALTFGWIEMERQVRVEGIVSKTSRAAVEAYFQTRPRGSRLGAWASDQSNVIPNRAILESKLAEADARFRDDVPPPPEWGGYCVLPERIEFWQGRTNRLHDRLRYRKNETGWIIERLAP
jgi:pyridoxamine 5'-phosphate oxidase